VAFSGLLCARKGIPTLLEAWKQLGLPGASLNLYGRLDPAMAESLREAGRHNILVRGFVDLKSELPRNDLFVFPSTWEGSAKAVYEALACGLPVITTHNAGSVVEDGVQGFIVAVDDVSALAARIRYFYENREELSRFSSEARKLGQKYSWSHYAESVIDCYSRLAPVAGH
jgi:glycosyltransferase involved in cell wall biosynthesis